MGRPVLAAPAITTMSTHHGSTTTIISHHHHNHSNHYIINSNHHLAATSFPYNSTSVAPTQHHSPGLPQPPWCTTTTTHSHHHPGPTPPQLKLCCMDIHCATMTMTSTKNIFSRMNLFVFLGVIFLGERF